MELTYVKCNYTLWEFVRNLRNNPDVKAGFVNQEFISPKKHQEYMWSNWLYFTIVLESGEPVAYYRVICSDISFCVHPDHQGKGIGTKILERIKINYPEAKGKVKPDNWQSARAFKKAGYTATYITYENDIQEHSS